MRVEALAKKAAEEIKKMDSDGKVGFIALFGSTALKRRRKASDIDLAVYYDGDKRERFRFRVKALGRLSNKFDVQIFQDLPLYIRNDVLSGKVLFYRDFASTFNIFRSTWTEYEDFKKYLDMYYERLAGARHGKAG